MATAWLNDNYATTTIDGNQLVGGDWDSLSHILYDYDAGKISFQTDEYYSAGRAMKLYAQGMYPNAPRVVITNQTVPEFWVRSKILLPSDFDLDTWCVPFNPLSEYISAGTYLSVSISFSKSLYAELHIRKRLDNEIIWNVDWSLGFLTKGVWQDYKIYILRHETNGILRFYLDGELKVNWTGCTKWQQAEFTSLIHRLYASETEPIAIYFDDPFFGDYDPDSEPPPPPSYGVFTKPKLMVL